MRRTCTYTYDAMFVCDGVTKVILLSAASRFLLSACSFGFWHGLCIRYIYGWFDWMLCCSLGVSTWWLNAKFLTYVLVERVSQLCLRAWRQTLADLISAVANTWGKKKREKKKHGSCFSSILKGREQVEAPKALSHGAICKVVKLAFPLQKMKESLRMDSFARCVCRCRVKGACSRYARIGILMGNAED